MYMCIFKVRLKLGLLTKMLIPGWFFLAQIQQCNDVMSASKNTTAVTQGSNFV